MKSIIKIFPILILFVFTLFTACKKDPQATSAAAIGSLSFEFENMVGDSALKLNTQSYVNRSNDTFKVSNLNYYISNIRLKRADGTEFAEPQSYHLIKQSYVESFRFTIKDVPAGEYASVTFTVGVDSLHNVSGAQTGALDPQNGMFWSWNSGYIMTMLEGTSPQSTQSGKGFFYHVGGFSGQYSGIRTITLSLPQHASVSDKIIPEIHMKTDILKWFDGPAKVSLKTVSAIHMPGPSSKMLADNYAAGAFSVEHVHNN